MTLTHPKSIQDPLIGLELIHALGSLYTTTTCRSSSRRVSGLRRHPRGSRREFYARSCIPTPMRRHCLSKPTWRPLCGERNYSLPFALCFYPNSRGALSGSSVHYGIRLHSGSTEALQSSDRSPSFGWT